MRKGVQYAVLTAVALCACTGSATEYAVDPVQSFFAIVVHKAGIAARLAHNHLIYPTKYATTLSVDHEDATTAQFSLEFATNALEADAESLHTKWYPAIEKAGILNEPFR